MPSPIEATSRRMAWLSVTTCSVAMVSGSARRIATCAIERAVCRISCARRITEPMERKKMTGPMRAKAEIAACGLNSDAGKGRAMGEDEIADPQSGPGRGGDDRRGEGGRVGAGLEALQNLADGGAVVVGGARAGGRPGRLGLLGEPGQFVGRDFGQALRARARQPSARWEGRWKSSFPASGDSSDGAGGEASGSTLSRRASSMADKAAAAGS